MHLCLNILCSFAHSIRETIGADFSSKSKSERSVCLFRRRRGAPDVYTILGEKLDYAAPSVDKRKKCLNALFELGAYCFSASFPKFAQRAQIYSVTWFTIHQLGAFRHALFCEQCVALEKYFRLIIDEMILKHLFSKDNKRNAKVCIKRFKNAGQRTIIMWFWFNGYQVLGLFVLHLCRNRTWLTEQF